MRGVCRLLGVYALTPVHVGVGRSPGVVDLPVVRDSYGLPFVPASSIKGVLKSSCLLGCGYSREGCGECLSVYGWDVRLEEAPGEASVSALVFGDAFLAFYPVRFDDGDGMFFGYATSVAQLAQLLDLVEGCWAAGGRVCPPARLLRECVSGASCERGGEGFFNNVPVGAGLYVDCSRGSGGVCRAARLFARVLLRGAGSLAGLLGRRIYVFTDQAVFREVVEAGMVRQARVRLDPVRKTVERGALWTEEYVPQATVFAGIVAARPKPGMAAEEAMAFLERQLEEAGGAFFIGGKETIGKGFARISLHEPPEW